MQNNYKQLSLVERSKIDFALNNSKAKVSIQEIADELKRNKVTIYREINKHSVEGKYNCVIAQTMYEMVSKHKYMFKKLKHVEFIKYLYMTYDRRTNSIEMVVENAKREFPGLDIPTVQTIYNWINSNELKLSRKSTTRSYYKKGGKRDGGQIGSLYRNHWTIPIGLRSQTINDNIEFGHWEIDLIVGRKEDFWNVISFVERFSRYSVFIKFYGKYAHSLNKAIYDYIKYEDLIVKSITSDNGIEFEKLGLVSYWLKIYNYKCEPHSSYQRGINENRNGMFRRFFPKRTFFGQVDVTDIVKAQNQINSTRLKVLGGRTPLEVYKEQIKKCK